MSGLLDALEHFFDNSSAIRDLGNLINEFYFPTEYAQEIKGCAAAMGVEYGWLTWVNLGKKYWTCYWSISNWCSGYEVSEGCTSIVAQDPSGLIYHVRNMDFWDGIWLTDHLKNLTITVSTRILFTSTPFNHAFIDWLPTKQQDCVLCYFLRWIRWCSFWNEGTSYFLCHSSLTHFTAWSFQYLHQHQILPPART